MTSRIAKHLSIGDLKSCVQVSRGFESHFTPHLWHTIHLEQLELVCRGARAINGCPHKCAIPNVIWNAESVKRLYFDAGTFVHGLNRLQKMLLLECTNVEKLEVEALEDDHGSVPSDLEEEAWAILTKFLKTNRKLRSVHLHTSLRHCNEAWIEALETLPHLEDIHVDNVIISSLQFVRLLRLMPDDAAAISSITLCNFRIIGSFPCLKNIASPSDMVVTRLSLNRLQEIDWNHYVELIRRFSSSLISLGFYFLEPSKSRQRKFRAIDFVSRVLGRLQKLEELSLRSVVSSTAGNDTSTLLDETFPGILRALPSKVVKLKVPGSGFSSYAIKTFENEEYFKKIQELDLDECESFSSTMALHCLESCPELVKFIAPEILLPDVLLRKSKPWRCIKMEHLQICFHGKVRADRRFIHGRDQDLVLTGYDEHDAIYKKLGKLTRLVHLDLGNHNVQSSYNELQPEQYCKFAGIGTPEPHDDMGYRGWNGEYYPCTHVRDFAAYYTRFGQLRLGYGIGLIKLKNLKRLQYLGLKNLGVKLSKSDARWMHDHWPDLRQIDGSLHCEPGKSVQRFALALGIRLEDEEDPAAAADLLESSEDELSDCGGMDSSSDDSSE
ncbi:hypothetical protein MVEG_12158 [Podila verticillata NRRL 6337]|uniref:F-box domain-containing protein n=1 Tax=Podila verticillata NRRL 6337 TaxID=1069443 RepID=A0A086TJ77_9FUNG|nr:hypothetical protein MVEG_12158 [Podila verticillata NRRL 6337]